MTWNQLLDILTSMGTAGHSSLDKPIELFNEEGFSQLDVFESLHTGDVYFMAAVKPEEDDGT